MLKFELSLEMLNVIGEALGNGPHKVVAPVIAELQKQINAQQQSAETVRTAPEVSTKELNVDV
jgi:hypothetical protein